MWSFEVPPHVLSQDSMDADLAFDPARLDAHLRARLTDLDGPMRIARVAGGQSNPTFFVTFDNRRLVLRKQPPGALLPSAHAIDREFRVIAALAGSAVPVPKALFFCGDRSIVGTPFYVMERLEGRVFHDCALPGCTPDERRALYRAMAETLAALHGIDPVARGLGDYGRPARLLRPAGAALVGPVADRADARRRRGRAAHRLAAREHPGRPQIRHRAWRLPDRQPDVPSDRAARRGAARLGALDARAALERSRPLLHRLAFRTGPIRRSARPRPRGHSASRPRPSM